MSSKLCLDCARRRLAKKPDRSCAACALVNVDPLARVRATYAKPSPLRNFSFASLGLSSFSSEVPAQSRRWRRGAD